ncbi:MAG TPA: histidine phosphatase family protein [Caulobacteraceae bacterium]|jgi:broad specificity phosphatase PhoE
MTSDTFRSGDFEARPARAAALAPRFGSIVLARHGEPKLSRKIRLTAAQYRQWWARYEEGGLLEGQIPPVHITDAAKDAELIFASTRARSIETARAVAGEKTFTSDEIFIEAPLPPPAFPGFVRLPPRAWGVIARFWWWFLGHHDGQETKAQAKLRAAKAAARLHEKAAEGHDVLVVAHGFFNTMVGLELQRKGWRCVHDQGFRYWSTRKFERG